MIMVMIMMILIMIVMVMIIIMIVMMIHSDDDTTSRLPIDTRNLCQGHDTTVTLRSSISRSGPIQKLMIMLMCLFKAHY